MPLKHLCIRLLLASTFTIVFCVSETGLRAQTSRNRLDYSSAKGFAKLPAPGLPDDVKKAIAAALKQAVFEVSGATAFSGQVLAADELIFQPGSTLVMTGLRGGDSIIIIADTVVLQDPRLANKIIRDPAFAANPGSPGSPGAQGQPNYAPPNETFRSANGGGGGNGGNGTSGETFKPPSLYFLVKTMTHPVIPSRFVIDFAGLPGGSGGSGGAGGHGGHGDVGWGASCNWLGMCNSGPGRGGDGGPGGSGGMGGPAVAGGPGFDLIIGGSTNFTDLAEQFTLLNKGGEPGSPGSGGPGGGGGERGRGGQTCGQCNSRGDGVDGGPGGSLGSGSPSTTKGPDGIITFASGIDVDTLLPKVAIIIPKGGGGVKHPQDKGEIHP